MDDEEVNGFHRYDFYLARIAAEIRRSNQFASNRASITDDKMRIKFVKGESKKTVRAKVSHKPSGDPKSDRLPNGNFRGPPVVTKDSLKQLHKAMRLHAMGLNPDGTPLAKKPIKPQVQ